ncbi:MAG: fructose-bisphosphatase class II [Anaplasmataceae bacterium]|nr:fructose-bisphosphatase class II [Anaplasmataceae bacterium]
MDNNKLYKDAFIKIVEDAAIASYKYAGSGDNDQADLAAVSSMRNNLQNIENLKIKVAIGEGERDKAPMLYINEVIGDEKAINSMEIAVDPLEGTSICADYKPGAITVLAYGAEGAFLRAPDCYMNKIIVGSSLKNADISLDYSVYDNLRNIAKEKSCNINDIVIVLLKRERNQYIVDEIRKHGAKIRFIDDGDIAVALEFILQDYEYFSAANFIGDVYMGIGGAPEGILAATAIKNLGGKMQGKLLLDTPKLCEYAASLGINDYNKVYNANDFVKKDAVLVISGVTSGNLLHGIKYLNNKIYVNSMVFEKNNFYLINKVKQYG